MNRKIEFPKTYASSSAAYRAIRQYEEKNGESGLVMTKIEKGIYEVGKGNGVVVNKPFQKTTAPKVPKMNIKGFELTNPKVVYNGTTYKFFPDGTKGMGYYELKTGERRRPNSIFKTLNEVFEYKSKNVI